LLPLKTFIVYSSKDRELREELEFHLRPLRDMGWLDVWSDKQIQPGEVWDAAIKRELRQAGLVILLVSVDFYNSDYIRNEEFKLALQRHQSGQTLLLPIIVRHCSWKYYQVIKDLQVLPEGGHAVSDLDHWKSRDKAWSHVVEKIADRVEQMKPPDPPPVVTPAASKPKFELPKLTLEDFAPSLKKFVERENQLIIDWLADDFLRQEKVDLRKDNLALQRLKNAADQARQQLTLYLKPETKIDLPYITAIDGQPKHLSRTLTLVQLNELVMKK
jgi:hypothetical protein